MVANEWAVATRVDLCEEKIILLTMAMIVTMVMTRILIRMPIAHHRTEAPSRNLDSLLHLHNKGAGDICMMIIIMDDLSIATIVIIIMMTFAIIIMMSGSFTSGEASTNVRGGFVKVSP